MLCTVPDQAVSTVSVALSIVLGPIVSCTHRAIGQGLRDVVHVVWLDERAVRQCMAVVALCDDTCGNLLSRHRK